RLGLATPLTALMIAPRTEVVFVSRHLRDALAARAPAVLARRLAERARISPMGIDLERFERARAALEGRPRPDRPRVVFLGRLVPIKGADVLVAAAARLCGPAEVIIAGAGAEAPGLARRIAADRRSPGVTVELRGQVRGVDRDRLLASADVVVLPSRPAPHGRTE